MIDFLLGLSVLLGIVMVTVGLPIYLIIKKIKRTQKDKTKDWLYDDWLA